MLFCDAPTVKLLQGKNGDLCLGGRLLAHALSAHLALYLYIVDKHRLESALRLHGVMLFIV